MSRGYRVWIGRIPSRCYERDIADFFRGYGRVTDIMVKQGFAFIEFADRRDAEDAVYELHGRTFMGDRVSVEMAKGQPHGRDAWGGRSSVRGRPERSDYRMIVENLSTRVEWPELKEVCQRKGLEAVYADAHTRKEREGLIEFATKRDLEKGIDELDGYELNGRAIKAYEDPNTRRRRDGSRSRSRSRRRSRSRSGRRSRSGSSRSRSKSRTRSKSRSKSKSRSRSPTDKKSVVKKDEKDDKKSKSRSVSPASGKEGSRSPAKSDKSD